MMDVGTVFVPVVVEETATTSTTSTAEPLASSTSYGDVNPDTSTQWSTSTTNPTPTSPYSTINGSTDSGGVWDSGLVLRIVSTVG
jgi:hypothetical protein